MGVKDELRLWAEDLLEILPDARRAVPAGQIEVVGGVKALVECHHESCEVAAAPHFVAQFDAPAEVKAVEEIEDGLLIEGIAADLGIDRQEEAFEPGVLEAAVKSMSKNPILTYHHMHPIGQMWHSGSPVRMVQFGEIRELAPAGDGTLRIKAFIPHPHEPLLQDVYDKVKRGMMKGLSVGGRFWKHLRPEGWRIHRTDLMEVAVTPNPVNPNTLITRVTPV